MKTTLRWTLSAGLVLASGLTGLGHATAVASPETSLAITIHVRNYAGVTPQILTQAEQVATEIYRKAGVETRWADIVLSENSQVNSVDHQAFTLADIQLSIFPDVMSDRLGLSNSVMGLAPCTGPDRGIVYVFDSKVRNLSWTVLSAYTRGDMDRRVSKGQVLGHAIAHEVGHLLLNQQGHSALGIMRGEWGFADLRDAADGLLLFTPQQGEFLRADVRSRNTRQDTFKDAALESPVLAP
jgi:predicted Zn-dependent protease